MSYSRKFGLKDYDDSDLKFIRELMRRYFAKNSLDPTGSTYERYYDPLRNAINGGDDKTGPITSRYLMELYTENRRPKRRQRSKVELIRDFLLSDERNTGASTVTTDSPISYDEIEISKVANHLRDLYWNENKHNEGLDLARQAFDKYGPHPKILKQLFRFLMRRNDWPEIETTIKKAEAKVVHRHENLEPRLQVERTALYALNRFERDFRKIEVLGSDDSDGQTKQLDFAREHYLARVPVEYREQTEQFYGWEGRWFLKIWWLTTKDSRKEHLLRIAKERLEKALEIAKKRNINAWWLQCYYCIVLKLLNGHLPEDKVESFRKAMSSLLKKDERREQTSVKVYYATSLLLTGDINELSRHVRSTRIKLTDFESTIYYHLDLLYYDEKGIAKMNEQEKVRSLIRAWLRSQDE